LSLSLETEVDGAPMVFPLGTEPLLELGRLQYPDQTGRRETTACRCKLKPGYRFEIPEIAPLSSIGKSPDGTAESSPGRSPGFRNQVMQSR
jgi:hypothetical protein